MEFEKICAVLSLRKSTYVLGFSYSTLGRRWNFGYLLSFQPLSTPNQKEYKYKLNWKSLQTAKNGIGNFDETGEKLSYISVSGYSDMKTKLLSLQCKGNLF